MTDELQIMLAVATVAVSAGATYGVMKMKINTHEEKFKKNDGKFLEIEKKIDALEEAQKTEMIKLREKIEKLEVSINRFIDRDTAEKKFVTQRELELHLRNIDQRVLNIEKRINSMDGKLDEILKRLK